MSNSFVLAQIIGLCAMIISILIWQIKKPHHIILAYIPASILWGIQYMLLGAPLGVLTNFTSAIKDTAISFVPERYLKIIISAFLCLVLTIGLYLYQYWYDILPLIAISAYNIALLRRGNRGLMARSSVLGQLCWIIYNCIVGAWMGIACGLLVGTSTIIGMARHEEWEIGRCHRTFFPSLAKSLFVFPSFRTYP